VNERHPSEYSPHYDAYGYEAYSPGSHQTVGTAFTPTTYSDDTTGTYAYPPQVPQYDQWQGQGQGPVQGYGGYGYDAGHPTGHHQPAAPEASGYDTGGYATYDPYAYAPTPQQHQQAAGATYYDTGTYDAGALWQGSGGGQQQQQQQQQDWDSGAYPAYGSGQGYGYDVSGDTGLYEQLPPTSYETPAAAPAQPPDQARDPYTDYSECTEHSEFAGHTDGPESYAATSAPLTEVPEPDLFGASPDDEPVQHAYASDGPSGEDGPVARSRRRKPARRSALLTVAVPSVAVMGVAAVGAAAVAGVGLAQDSSTAQADGQGSGAEIAKMPATQLDRQLAGVSRDAGDFATRANRTQERIDLKDRQAAAKKAKAEAAARREALRPKFLLPVKERGLSAYYGQAGVNWMALHTGIDFPVQTGTPVMAVTDGTVRTQWNGSYGYMAIVTAADGTETWYCHLNSTKVRSGSVKAGEVIAYSGNTGNTTGPHLHLEVRPDGGSPIDPLPWLLAHGLDPR
jgi:murein DD-endopeptidase MepM/ murein hydrolase activator NlpD